MNPQVDEFLHNATIWQKEMMALRAILLDCGLVEDFKWRQPCYTFEQNNISIIGAFKDFCVMSFFKGVLLSDEAGILVQAGENTLSARIVKITDANQIKTLEPILKAYIYEAIEVEKAGLKVPKKDNSNLDFPEELLNQFQENSNFRTAFQALTPGRQRAYNMHFSSAKQSETRTARIENYKKRIMHGIGMNDCICGHSKRMPNCDGSHKYIDKSTYENY